MINPLLATLDELAGTVGAPPAQLYLVFFEVRLNALGRKVGMRHDTPVSADFVDEALITEAFDDFPDPFRVTFEGKVGSHAVPGGYGNMTSLQVRITFPRKVNSALSGEVSAVVSPSAAGLFEVQVDLFFDGSVRRPFRLEGQATIENATLPAPATKVILTNVNLDFFLDFVETWEPKSGAKSRLAFVSSLRKVVNTATDFDFVVGSVKGPTPTSSRLKPEPLFPVGRVVNGRRVQPESTMAGRVKAASHLRFGGEAISISHVLIGIEGGRRQDPKPSPEKLEVVPVFRRPGNLVTWAGDLAGALSSRYIFKKYYLRDPNARTLDDYIAQTASRADLIGDIDGVNLAAAYDDKLSLSANLRRYYYGSGSAHRFSLFIQNAEKADGSPALGLAPGGGEPRLTAASRQFIAEQVELIATLILVKVTKLNKDLSAELRHWVPPFPEVTAMLRTDSPEVQKLTNIFASLIEAGLAAEPSQ